MGTTTHFEQALFPPGLDGRADLSEPSTVVEVFVSNYFGDHQVSLRLIDGTGESILHLTKQQAMELSEALENAALSIGYDNR